MKNLFYLSSLVVFTTIFMSCHVDQTNQETTAVVLEQRTTNWCDGGETSPTVLEITGYTKVGDECCYNFRFRTAYAGKNFVITTTDWNFNTNSGNPADNHQYPGNSGSGTITFCFPQQGSHFLIEILDGNGLPFACNSFPNLCE